MCGFPLPLPPPMFPLFPSSSNLPAPLGPSVLPHTRFHILYMLSLIFSAYFGSLFPHGSLPSSGGLEAFCRNQGGLPGQMQGCAWKCWDIQSPHPPASLTAIWECQGAWGPQWAGLAATEDGLDERQHPAWQAGTEYVRTHLGFKGAKYNTLYQCNYATDHK